MQRVLASFAPAILAALVLVHGPALAEPTEIRIAKQYGLGYLQMMVMEDQKMVEKQAKAPSRDAATIIPWDSMPRSFRGARLATMTTFRPTSASGL